MSYAILKEIGLAVEWVVTYSFDGVVEQRKVAAESPSDVRRWLLSNMPSAEIKEIVQAVHYDRYSAYSSANGATT